MTTDLQELFGNLTIEATSEPLPPITRGQASSLPNPFGPAIKASIEHDSAYSIYVPADAVNRSVSLINAAARTLNHGVRIVVNVRKDSEGHPVKDAEGKVQYVAEPRGEHKGKVLVRFQGKAERKQASAPRTYSIVNDPAKEGQKMLRRRSDNRVMARGTHDEMRAELARHKALDAEGAPQVPSE
jgi:hypothetical protein